MAAQASAGQGPGNWQQRASGPGAQGGSYILVQAEAWQASAQEMLIDEHLARGWLGLVHGPQGSGKTMITLHAVYHVTGGWSWRGRPTTPVPVIYVCPGGMASVKRRLDALARYYRKALSPLLLLTDSDPRDDPEGFVAAIAAALPGAAAPGLIVLDFGQQFAVQGYDLAGLGFRLRELTAAAVMIHHEAPTVPAEIAHGWDLIWRLERSIEEHVVLNVEHQRDGGILGRLVFEVRADGDGALVTATRQAATSHERLTEPQQAVMNELLLRVNATNDWQVSEAVFRELALAACELSLRGKPPKRQQEQITRWLLQLKQKGLLRYDAGMVIVRPKWRSMRRRQNLDMDELHERAKMTSATECGPDV